MPKWLRAINEQDIQLISFCWIYRSCMWLTKWLNSTQKQTHQNHVQRLSLLHTTPLLNFDRAVEYSAWPGNRIKPKRVRENFNRLQNITQSSYTPQLQHKTLLLIFAYFSTSSENIYGKQSKLHFQNNLYDAHFKFEWTPNYGCRIIIIVMFWAIAIEALKYTFLASESNVII